MHVSLSLTSKSALAALAALAALGLAAGPASAQVTIGTGNTGSGNYIPFGNGASLTYPQEYQQLYNPAAFAAPLTIDSIGFASVLGTPGPATFDATIKLSITGTPFDNPSTTFIYNEGADVQTVFSGVVSTTLQKNGTFDLVFPTTPFTYDPSLGGTLVLDVLVNSTPTLPDTPTYFESDDSGADIHRVYTFGGVNGTDTTGLVTEFNAPAVPEASTTVSLGLLLTLGMGGIVIAAKRKKASSAL